MQCVCNTPFDASEYSVVSFDYRVDETTKIDFYVRVAGRWYDIGFTDDPNEYRNKDLNIAYLGSIPGIVADGQWAPCEF